MLAFPKPSKAEQRAEDAAQAQGLIHYERVQALVQAGDLAGAVQAISPFPGGHYFSQAVEAVARGQVQAD